MTVYISEDIWLASITNPQVFAEQMQLHWKDEFIIIRLAPPGQSHPVTLVL